MKTTLLGLALGICLTPVAIQASPKHGDHHHQHMLERMDKELDLTDEQRKEVKDLFQSHHAKFKALREETHARLENILDDEQQLKLETIKAERKARWQKKFKAHHHDKIAN